MMSYFSQSDLVMGDVAMGEKGYKHITIEGKSRFSKPELGGSGQPFLCGLIT